MPEKENEKQSYALERERITSPDRRCMHQAAYLQQIEPGGDLGSVRATGFILPLATSLGDRRSAMLRKVATPHQEADIQSFRRNLAL